MHGDRTQPEHKQALNSFKRGQTPIMVATGVAAHGHDIPHVAHTINFDLSKDIDDCVHQIGRTGRAGKSGLATAFFNDRNQPLAKALSELMKESSQEVPDWLVRYSEGASYSSGRSYKSSGSRFSGYDYRKDASLSRGNYQSNSYGGGNAGGRNSGIDCGPYYSQGYDLANGPIIVNGWD